MPFHLLTANIDQTMNSFLLAGILLFAGAIVPSILRGVPRLAHISGMILSAAGSIVGVYAALIALQSNGPSTLSIPWSAGAIQISFTIDGLAAFFLLPIFVLGFCAALYGYSYLSHDILRTNKVAFHWFFFNILMLSMAAVVTAGNGLQFLISWEGMSISSFFLVCYDYENDEVCKAGWLYFMATHLGVAFLFFFFLTAASISGSLDFASFTALSTLSPALTGSLFILILLGFGSKAGLFPMHIWLPEAHPAAPSHVSALMSGVMIKTAVYGFLRMLTFLPPLPQWCIIVLLTAGLIGSVFGISMAASQNDIKRSLAYSTVENINLIFLGIGLWLFGVNAGWPVMAGLALIGFLLHIWNHALFKGLLFLGAGSILHGTGSRFFSSFGGLLKRMPFTGAMIIFGSAAIAGLPPLNGFISELYLYMSVVVMGQKASPITAFSALLILSIMILTGGLVLLVVCRLSGMALLGEARKPETERTHESAPLMLFAMAILLGLCVLIGVAPSLPLSLLKQPFMALTQIPNQSMPVLPFFIGSPWTIAASIFLICIFAAIFIRKKGAVSTPKSATWGCGFQHPNRRMVYSSGGFSELAQSTVFCRCVNPDNKRESSPGLFQKPAFFKQNSNDPILLQIFKPFFSNLAAKANSCHKIQAGKLNIYILYIFIATILLLGLNVFQN